MLTFREKKVHIETIKTKTKNIKKSLIHNFLTYRMEHLQQSLGKLHKSVLLNELVSFIEMKNWEQNIIVDATLGMAGHASRVIQKMNEGDIFVWFDADERNLSKVSNFLQELAREKKVQLHLVNENFSKLKEILSSLQIPKITAIYYDLWLSSLHVDEQERGFSFQHSGPLDMRFDTKKSLTARKILLSYPFEKLRYVFQHYGEEPFGNKIASQIVEARQKWVSLETTHDLVSLIQKVTHFPKAKTRIFQALRIEVNDELRVLERSLEDAIDLLEDAWRIFVISFHSLEDRIVKNIFRQESSDCICTDILCTCNHKKKLTKASKKPIIPSEMEIQSNPRSRSAKARCALKQVIDYNSK